jgi:hypothetical protein
MNRFIAADRTPGGPKGPEMLARLDPAFDSPMILFQDVIEVLHWSYWQFSSRAPSALSSTIAGGQPACLSVLITRGAGWFSPPKALVKHEVNSFSRFVGPIQLRRS